MKPMLACSTIPALSDIAYPVIATPKIDGIRCLIVDGVPVTRNLKPIPNRHVTEVLSAMDLPNLDGELTVVGDFNSVQSALMSRGGSPDFMYNVFDLVDESMPYMERLGELKTLNVECCVVKIVPSVYCLGQTELASHYKHWLAEGFEGAIVRAPQGPYKFGRSTQKQGWMLKLKNFNDAEAEVIGVEELMHNDNEPELDNLGRTVRSSHQENHVPMDALGALVCTYKGQTFKIGTGFTAEQRRAIWLDPDTIGKLAKFKYQELSKYGVPRFPVFLGFRDRGDM